MVLKVLHLIGSIIYIVTPTPRTTHTHISADTLCPTSGAYDTVSTTAGGHPASAAAARRTASAETAQPSIRTFS
jgi:hypothetical protein